MIPVLTRGSGENFHVRPSMTTKLLVFVIAVFAFYFCYNLRFASQPNAAAADCLQRPLLALRVRPSVHSAVAETLPPPKKAPDGEEITSLGHVAFGIAASAKLWSKRKAYIKQWWRSEEMRGAVWLDESVKAASTEEEQSLPPLMISAETSEFPYRNSDGHRSAIRISRIVAEMARLVGGLDEGVRWFVMGDDDTVFVVENLLRVLRKYDHRQPYYIGSTSESHIQNINFSYKMAYGGGGFAISAPLVAELVKIQDRCIHRYPELYGSDDRLHACMAELGVPLTRELGFHQFDVYGSVFGLLAAHPVTPLVTLHHLDIINPIFPNTDRVNAIKKLTVPMGLDSAALAQQSICYDPARNWTVSVSWGYAVQIFRGVLLPREVEIPGRTFLNWYQNTGHVAHAFNSRPYSKNTCQTPFVYYLSEAVPSGNRTLTRYGLHRDSDSDSDCKWKTPDPSLLHNVEVYKTPDPHMWDKAPRRNCCRILPNEKQTLEIDVGPCHEGEFQQL